MKQLLFLPVLVLVGCATDVSPGDLYVQSTGPDGGIVPDTSSEEDAGAAALDAAADSRVPDAGSGEDAPIDVVSDASPDLLADLEADDIPEQDAQDPPDTDPDVPGDDVEEDVPVSRTGQPVPPAVAAILDDIPGYAQGTIGGREGTLYEVTTLDAHGEGSLRAALESDAPLWIVFAEGLQGTIPLDGQIRVRSYKTVDARGHQITLLGVRDVNEPDILEGWGDTGLTLGEPGNQAQEVRDVVFLNLTFNGAWPHPDQDGEGADGIYLHNNVHHVWVHQCTFHNWNDGAIDARVDEGFGTLPHHISITSSHFYDINQGLLLEARRVTFGRNFCDNVNVRCVKTLNGGSAHIVNSVIKDWRGIEIVFAEGDSRILVDHNIFRPGEDSRLAGRATEGGEFQDLHNVRYGWSRYTMGNRGSVPSSFKEEAQSAYNLDRRVNCEHDPPDEDCWAGLYDDVVSQAGASPDN